MPFLFEKTLGRVYQLADPVAEGTIGLAGIAANDGGDNELSYGPGCRAIITKLGMSNAANFQFLHTIGNEVYVYVFGDRMGQVVLHGLSFHAGDCSGSKPTEHGFDQVYDWYKKNRVAVNSKPVVITIGIRTKFYGFITSFNADAQDAQNLTIPFQITVAVLPENQ